MGWGVLTYNRLRQLPQEAISFLCPVSQTWGGCSVGWGHRLDQAPTFLVTVWGDGWRGPAVCTDVKGCRGHVAQSPWNRPCHQVHTR